MVKLTMIEGRTSPSPVPELTAEPLWYELSQYLEPQFIPLLGPAPEEDSRRSVARLWTGANFKIIKDDRKSSKRRFFDLTPTESTNELLVELDKFRYSESSSCLLPSLHSIYENPLHHRHIFLAEYATAFASKKEQQQIPDQTIREASLIILDQFDKRIHPSGKMAKAKRLFADKDNEEAEYQEALMLNRLIEAATSPKEES